MLLLFTLAELKRNNEEIITRRGWRPKPRMAQHPCRVGVTKEPLFPHRLQPTDMNAGTETCASTECVLPFEGGISYLSQAGTEVIHKAFLP